MARAPKKKPAVPAQVDDPNVQAQPESVEPKKPMSYEVKVSDALAPVGGFDPRKNLRTVCAGVFRYLCDDVESFDEKHFETKLAKEYGIKENDLIYLVAKKKHRIVVV